MYGVARLIPIKHPSLSMPAHDTNLYVSQSTASPLSRESSHTPPASSRAPTFCCYIMLVVTPWLGIPRDDAATFLPYSSISDRVKASWT